MGLRVIGPAADGVRRSGYPGGPPDLTDTYSDKLVKLVPAEMLPVYPVFASQAKPLGGTMLILTSWAFLLLVIVWRWKATSVPGKGGQWGAVLIAAFAFFIWAHVMGGDFGVDWLLNKLSGIGAATELGDTRAVAPVDAALTAAKAEQQRAFVTNFSLFAWTFGAPLVYKGDQES
jgi:hypothetical protein